MSWTKIDLGKSVENRSIKTVNFGLKVIGINAAFTNGLTERKLFTDKAVPLTFDSVDIYANEDKSQLSFAFQEGGKGDLKIGVNKGGGWAIAARGLRNALGERYPLNQKFELQSIDGEYVVDLAKPLGVKVEDKAEEVTVPNAKD